MSSVKLISITPDAEKLIAYLARVSNPRNQDNDNIEGLLRYCIKHGHWSIFEQANITIEITTTRAISAQIIRHRSFSFQEFSQRYASVDELAESFELPELRKQDIKNRQNSTNDLPKEIAEKHSNRIAELINLSLQVYRDMLDDGVAKECARAILPMCAPTRLYMTGYIRSWIHYIELREGNGTQLEHAQIAKACKQIFTKELPVISSALGWV